MHQEHILHGMLLMLFLQLVLIDIIPIILQCTGLFSTMAISHSLTQFKLNLGGFIVIPILHGLRALNN